MKNYFKLFLAIAGILHFSCSDTTIPDPPSYQPFPVQPGQIRIQGQTDHLQEDFSPFVRLLDDPIGSNFPIEIAVDTLDKHGHFALNAQLDRPREVFFEFNNRRIALLLAPGDDFELYFPADYYNGLHQVYSALQVKGKGAGKNKLMFAFLHGFRRRFDNNAGFGQRWMMDEEEYLQFWVDAEASQNQFLDSFLMAHPQADPAFEQWAKHKIYYEVTRGLIEYPQIRKDRQKNALPVTQAYIDQIKKRKLDEPNAIGSRAFLQALGSYRTDDLQNPPGLFFNTLQFTKVHSTDVKTELDQIQRQPAPLLREWLSAQYMDCLLEQDHWQALEPHYDTFLSTFVDTTLRTYLERKRRYHYDTLALPLLSSKARIIAIHPQQPLENLLEKRYKGKVICLTQWNTCQAQWGLRSLPRAVETCKDVAFVYIAHHSPPAHWHRKLASDDYPGDHLLLTNEAYQEIDSLFFHNDRRYPHLLIDRQGAIQKGQNWLFGRYLIKALQELSKQ